MTKNGNDLYHKDKRKNALERKKKDKLKRNLVAKDLSSPLYRLRVEETKEKGGSKNLLKEIYEDKGE